MPIKAQLKSKITLPPHTSKNQRRFPWMVGGFLAVFLLSLGLRFWHINYFNALVFDEAFYAVYGVNYLDKLPVFDAHPPLGKYAIAFAIWLASHLPFSTGEVNGLTGMVISPFSYRWLNALVGSFLPLIVGAIAYQISGRLFYGLLASFFTALDGLLLVESRLALINLYLVFFGALGQYLFLIAIKNRGIRSNFWLLLAGLCFGCSVSVKWNGLGFLFGVILTWLFAQLMYTLQCRQEKLNRPTIEVINSESGVKSFELAAKVPFILPPLQKRFLQLQLWKIILFLIIIPAIIYYLIWQPHLAINTDTNFLKVHQQIFGFHQSLKSGKDIHPYCSRWYTWPLTIRPVVYLFEKTLNTLQVVPQYPPLPPNVGNVIYDIHGMGNPGLATVSIAAILLLTLFVIQKIFVYFKQQLTSPLSPENFSFPSATELWVVCFIILNFAANFLPWILVSRCTFLYLYMPASIFTFMASAWLVERWFRSYKLSYQAVALSIIFLVSFAFIFWLPIYLGLPITPEQFNIRMWFQSWI